MKRTITNWKAAAVVSAAVLSVLLIAVPQAGSAQQMRKQELKALLASAKSREDHQKLAAYYRQETDRLLAEAQKHDEIGRDVSREPSSLHAEESGGVSVSSTAEIWPTLTARKRQKRGLSPRSTKRWQGKRHSSS